MIFRRTRRKGFSLIGVLIVSLCGVLIMGGVMGMHETFSGASRRSIRSDDVYNVLEREVERAKGSLKMAMILRKKAFRCADPETVTGLESLLALRPTDEGGGAFYDSVSSVKVGGKTGTLRVAIYDMLYEPDALDAIPDAERYEMPLAVTAINSTGGPGDDAPTDPDSSMNGGGGPGGDPSSLESVGVYLIRASLTLPSESDRRIDVAVTQNANPTL